MDFADRFLLMVQSAAIVKDIQTNRYIAAQVIEDAIKYIDYAKLSHAEEWGTAAKVFVNWCYDGKLPKPNFVQ